MAADTGGNTSDEEFERQLEEAALLEVQQKAERAATVAQRRMKKGKGRTTKKSKILNREDEV